MNLGQIVAKFRIRVFDTGAPPLWSAETVIDFANQAEREAAERAKLIEATMPITGRANVGTYTLPAGVIEVRSVTWDGRFLSGVSRDSLDRGLRGDWWGYGWLDSFTSGWKNRTGTPRRFIDPQEKYLTLVPIPTIAKDIELQVYRYPLEEMAADEDEPEIAEQHHFGLLDWMEHLAYAADDTETQDLKKSDRAEQKFIATFGAKIDASTRRKQRERWSNQVRMNPNW